MARTPKAPRAKSLQPTELAKPNEPTYKLFITPKYTEGIGREGGIRRVVEAQYRHLPGFGFDIVDDPREADIVACHAGDNVPKSIRRPDAVVVAHCHGLYWDDDEYSWTTHAHERNQKILDSFRRSDGVVVPCEWVADILRKDLWLDPAVVYNGTELPSLAQLDGHLGGPVLWNKARVDEVCEVDSLAKLVQKMPDVPFVSTLAPHDFSAPNLQLTGVMSHAKMLREVAQAGVYLGTTREVFSISVVEAMAYGVPVVGYNFGGQREIVEHRVNGWLVEPGDIAGLAAGVEYVLDPDHWLEMSRAARKTAERFAWKAQMSRLATYYRQVIAASKHDVKVSVVVPCYNLGEYVEQAVESALTQRVDGGHEVIIVDDASTDDSWQRINDHWNLSNRSNLHVVMHTENKYLAETLNDGISAARGKYILNLDADNVLPDGVLSRLATALDDNEQFDVVYGPVKFVQEDGVTPGHGVGKDGLPNPPWPPEKFDYTLQMAHHNQVQSSAMFRRRVWERAKGYRQHVAPLIPGRKDQMPRGASLSDGVSRASLSSGLNDTNGAGPLMVRLNSDAEFWCRVATLGFRFGNIGGAPTLVYRQRPGESMSSTVQDFDWTGWCPKARPPAGVSARIFTMEPTVVSVIVSVLPGAESVAWRSIESLWPQSFANWECIVIVASNYLDSMPVTGEQQWPPYTHVVRSFEEAVQRAKGTYVVPLDAGDYLRPDALARLLAAIQWSESTHHDEDRTRFAYSDWMAFQTREAQPANDAHVGAVMFPRRVLQAWCKTPDGRYWGTWRPRLAAAHLCGQYVDEPLMMVDGRQGYDTQRGDRELAGCGCGGGRRPAAKGGCVGPGCGPVRTNTSSSSQSSVTMASAPTYVTGTDSKVRMEYFGREPSRTFRTRNGVYRFSVDGDNRFGDVFVEDVPSLQATGVLRPAAPVPV